eukprot:Skav227779  [mRNA]  locus=scaffold1237:118472:120679:+ [translate_table: standard]
MSCVPGVPPRAVETMPQAVSVFIRNGTVSDMQKCCNATERFVCPTSNGTCGIPAPVWSETGCKNRAPSDEGAALVARGRISLQRTTQEVVASLAVQRFGLVLLVQRCPKEEMTKAIRRCERCHMVCRPVESLQWKLRRFFGGLTTEMKEELRAVACCHNSLISTDLNHS